MEIAHKRRPRLHAGAAQFLLGIAGVALVTFVCFKIGFGVGRTSLAYVIWIALVSLLGSFGVSVVVSIVAVACLNYFFVPPLFEFRVDDPDDIVRLAAFLTASLLVTALTTKLRASEERFRTFADYATDAFFLLDDHSTVLDVNRQACVGLGYSREELVGKHRRDFDVGLDDTSIESLKQLIVAEGAITFETRHRRRDGTSFPVEIRIGQFEQGGRRYLCVARDITERKRAEDELRTSEARFRSFINHATDGFFLFDEHQALVDVNSQACESLGYSREEMIGMHPRDFDAGLDEASIARIGEQVASGQTVTFETQHRRKDGTIFPVEIRARQFQHGAHRFRLSLARDITERKRTEEVLRENEARLQKAQHIAHFGWWERDLATSRVFLSDEVCRIFGLEAVDLPEWHARWLSLIHPEDQPRVAEAAAAALLPGGPRYDLEYRVIRPDGTVRIVHSQGDVTWNESGRPLRQFGVLQDITKLRQAEQEVRASEGRFRIFVDHASDAFFLLDDDWTILDVNRQACHGLGYSREELIGKHKSDFDVGLDDASIQRLKQRVVAGEAITFETHHRRKDGTSFPVEVALNQFEQGGRRYLCLVRDVTERKRAQEEHERFRELETDLAHMNRVSIMGELAASLAHEILHPIATARNNARAGMRYLEMSPPNLSEVEEALACVVRDADRAKSIVDRMRDHIKKAPPRSEPFDLNEAIDEVIEMAQSAITKNGVLVRTNLRGSLVVHGDRVQLQQVIMNLILNAVEAMNMVDEAARELSISTRQDQTSDVLVAVQDSGPGVEPELLDKVFAAFYTTKNAGIGMGLSICRSIISAHGGRLWVEANRPRGAIFQFTLPAGPQGS